MASHSFLSGVSAFIREANSYNRLTDEEVCVLVDAGKVEAMIKHHMFIVAQVAAGFSSNAVPYEDVLAAGMFGLMKAAQHYEPGKGYFHVFAREVIKNEIIRAIQNEARHNVSQQHLDLLEFDEKDALGPVICRIPSTSTFALVRNYVQWIVDGARRYSEPYCYKTFVIRYGFNDSLVPVPVDKRSSYGVVKSSVSRRLSIVWKTLETNNICYFRDREFACLIENVSAVAGTLGIDISFNTGLEAA